MPPHTPPARPSLERKDWTKFGTDIVPLPRRHTLKLGEGRRVRKIRIGNPRSIHRFLQHERNQIVHLPVKRGGGQIVLRTLVAETQHIAGIRLVESIVEIKLPSSISPCGIRMEDATERKSNVHKSAHGTYRPLRSKHRIPGTAQTKLQI